MVRITIVLLTVILFNTHVQAQELNLNTDTIRNQQEQLNDTTDTNNQDSIKSDIIHLHDGNKLPADVKKIYLNDLYYSLPGEIKVNKMDQRQVHKIEYKMGKVEILNENPPDIREVGDYRKVKITEDPDEVEGLIEIAKLEAKAEGTERGYSTPKSLDRTAIIIIRKKAALVNANIVLITGRKSNVGFGEVPSVTMKGTAYSYR